jgi:general stress protein YciG
MSKPRGFAALSPEKRREIASKGGKSVPSDKRTFATDRDLASRAGFNGGKASKRPSGKG